MYFLLNGSVTIFNVFFMEIGSDLKEIWTVFVYLSPLEFFPLSINLYNAFWDPSNIKF